MPNHPIEGLMQTAMQSIKEMVDVNTIVGDAVETPDGSVIIPISRVTFGFAAGGGEYTRLNDSQCNTGEEEEMPFGGGSGAGVTIKPVAFLVVGNGTIRLLSTESNSPVERIIDNAPQVLQQIQSMLGNKQQTNHTHTKTMQCEPQVTD